ncbi:hypothetical protein B0H14DRAFT_3888048 [Mycena olivaceomarginata]|nr:hypothetical protein B0H14DRAFT_3888048 [Mycena olivaceomarginata]
MPSLMWPLISGPICVLIALKLWMHYFHVITVPPGFADDPPVADSAKNGAQNSIFWASKKAPRRGELAGVRWSNELVITQAGVTKCRKCGPLSADPVSSPVHSPISATPALSTLHMADAPSRVPRWMPSRVAWRAHNWLPRGSQRRPTLHCSTPPVLTPPWGFADRLAAPHAGTHPPHKHCECSARRPAMRSSDFRLPSHRPQSQALTSRIANHGGACTMRWRWIQSRSDLAWARRCVAFIPSPPCPRCVFADVHTPGSPSSM